MMHTLYLKPEDREKAKFLVRHFKAKGTSLSAMLAKAIRRLYDNAKRREQIARKAGKANKVRLAKIRAAKQAQGR